MLPRAQKVASKPHFTLKNGLRTDKARIYIIVTDDSAANTVISASD